MICLATAIVLFCCAADAFGQQFPDRSWPVRKVPLLVKGPFGIVKPVRHDYYQPIYYQTQELEETSLEDDSDETHLNFNRAHASSPDADAQFHSLLKSAAADDATDDGYVPLREAVEHIPIQGEMTILLKNADEDDLPFSRSHVESFPLPFSPSDVYGQPRPLLYSASENQETEAFPDDRIGYRGDVEAAPSSPAQTWFNYFRGSDLKLENSDLQWIEPEALPDVLEFANVRSSQPNANEKRVVCYYESWASKRVQPMDFGITDIDPFSCSHLIYSFAGLENETLTLASLDPEHDIVRGAYKATVALKQRNADLKVLIAVGGWAEGGSKYSQMVSSPEKRDAFVQSVVRFIDDYGFDGLDIDWEYPGATDRGGRKTDKENVALLVEQLSEVFKRRGWILTMAVPIAKLRIDDGYDVQRLSDNLDFFNLMTYDLRGYWDGFADHHAPFTSKSTDKFIHKGLNLEEGVKLFVDYGAPKQKLVVGVPFYGRSFTLKSPEMDSPGSKVVDSGREGEYTEERGYVSYFEICMNIRNGNWKIKRDESGAPYMVKGDQWIGYDDVLSIKPKVNFIKNEGLGGVMIWAIDLDDFLGVCGTRWPLLSAIRNVLYSPESTDYIPTITESDITGENVDTTTVVRGTESPKPSTAAPVSLSGGVALAPDQSCQGSKRVPHPGDCQSFLVCSHGTYVEVKCGSGLHWNDEKQICDWPQNVQCGSKSVDTTANLGTFRPGTTSTQSPIGAQTTKSPVLEPAPGAGPLSGDYMSVCYFTNWAWYRQGDGKFTPDDIDGSVCTHVVYGFAVLDSSTLLIKPHDTWADIDNRFYERVTALRSKGIKVTIAIGGWNDSAGDKYSRLVNDPSARAKFIAHVLQFISDHNFDGLDLDWEYPVCWQVNCNSGPSSDKEAFGAFVRELSEAFKPRGLLLSAAVSPSKKVIDAGYDVPVLNRYLDWIAVMTYDFHGHWDKKTGHVAPLYYHPEDDYDYFNMDFAIRYWAEKGAQKSKLVLGMPLYGQSFTLDNPSVNGLNAPARQKGRAGPFTKSAGFLSYYEICENILNGWTVVKDPLGRMGPYAFSGNQWVSFDDVDTIKRKAEYIRDMGLGGGMVWALDLDDFRNRCGQEKYVLMKTIQSVLGPAADGTSAIEVSPKPVSPTTSRPAPIPTTMTTVPRPISPGTGTSAESGEYKVVCYYTNWSWYRQGDGKYLPEDIDPELCTHVNYGFVVLDPKTLTMKPHDTWADIDNKFYTRVTELRKRGVKVLAALGGWNDSADSKYSRLANDPTARRKFNEHALNFLMTFGFDGLDLDWEYPKCWQVDCSKGPASDKEAFASWVKELSELLKPRGLLLTAAVSPSYKVIREGYDVPALSKYLDFINVMTYDYHGQWDKKTGHVSPMYAHPDDEELKFNTDFTINHWIAKGADPKKLILGLPMYGQSFSLADATANGLNQKSYGGGEAGPYTRAGGFLAYYEICYFIKHHSWTVVRDPNQSMGPYAYKGNQWVGFDDVTQIKYKANYVKRKGLGGAMIWALDLDDFKNRCSCESHPLLKTINRVLRNYPAAETECTIGDGGQAAITGIAVTTEVTLGLTVPSSTFTARPAIVTSSTRIPHPPEVSSPPPPGSLDLTGSPCNKGEFRPHADCGKFYECYTSKFREVSCFAGLHWDGKRRCDYPSRVTCSNKRLSGAPPTAVIAPVESPAAIRPLRPSSVAEEVKPSIVTKQEGDVGKVGLACVVGSFASHRDCSKFYECQYGRLIERTCFSGLHWDGKERCNWPDLAKCTSQTGSGPVVTSRPFPSTTRRTTKTTRYTTRRTTKTWSPTQPSSTTQRTSSQWYVPWTPSTKATTPRPTHPPGSLEIDGYKVVCYFTNWAWYRRGIAKYRPEDIDPDLCTHIVYGFAVLNANTLLIKPHDTWADYDNDFYEKVTGWKARGIRVLLAIGGWNDSKGDKYSRLVNDANARAKFVTHVVEFIEKHNFDGLDLDWEYPKCWQVDCSKGPDSDKEGFSSWMKELSRAFKPRNWLLTAAVSPSYKVIDAGYNVRDLSRYLDFINVMTYDYHGHWDKKTGHVAPLYHHPESEAPEFNANYTIHYFIEKGADRKKLILGMPLYGQAFTLKNSSNTGLNSPGSKGRAGEFTRAAGFLAYYEICDRVMEKNYRVVKDPLGRIGPYAYSGNQWVGFDDVDSIRAKSEYIKKMGLGGGMIWALDLDDFNNRCNCEAHPLLKTINRELRNYQRPTANCLLA